ELVGGPGQPGHHLGGGEPQYGLDLVGVRADGADEIPDSP
ncbi:MAG: hypothetical protein QOG76_2434, partial [Pseudonocardiales bacterium]|nr:hypothetical protein [Pseudonocardiales bacterium]